MTAKYDASPEETVIVWQLAKSAKEAASYLKMPRPILSARISNYRSMGVDVKTMNRASRRTLDPERLRRAVAEAGRIDTGEGIDVEKINRALERLAREVPSDRTQPDRRVEAGGGGAEG
jgi:dihydroxyacetone kinase